MDQWVATCGSSLITNLSGDVILFILRKLAVSDPCSLLPAACACKFFHQQVKDNPGIWKEAFFGKESVSDQDRNREEQIEEVVVSFGGYERLVKARTWGECPERMRSSEQTWSDWLVRGGFAQYLVQEERLPNFAAAVTKHLVVLRDQGRLLLWGLLILHYERPRFWHCKREDARGDFEWDGAFQGEVPDHHIEPFLKTSRLQSVTSSGYSSDKSSELGRVKFSESGHTLSGPVSMDFTSCRTAWQNHALSACQ